MRFGQATCGRQGHARRARQAEIARGRPQSVWQIISNADPPGIQLASSGAVLPGSVSVDARGVYSVAARLGSDSFIAKTDDTSATKEIRPTMRQGRK